MISGPSYISKRIQLGALCFHRPRRYPKNNTAFSFSPFSSLSSLSTSSLSTSFPPPPLPPPSSTSWQRTRHLSTTDRILRRTYFTNGQVTKKDDPYSILGLQWGDGATTAEIRQAFRERAKALHPDTVDTTVMTVEQAHVEFQKLAGAYEALIKHVQADDSDNMEEWRVALWRQSDRIALDRNDVAGLARKRPVKSAQTAQKAHYGRELGHPSGKGAAMTRGEYLSDGTNTNTNTNNTNGKRLRSSSVGRGQSKWVKAQQKEDYKEWCGGDGVDRPSR